MNPGWCHFIQKAEVIVHFSVFSLEILNFPSYYCYSYNIQADCFVSFIHFSFFTIPLFHLYILIVELPLYSSVWMFRFPHQSCVQWDLQSASSAEASLLYLTYAQAMGNIHWSPQWSSLGQKKPAIPLHHEEAYSIYVEIMKVFSTSFKYFFCYPFNHRPTTYLSNSSCLYSEDSVCDSVCKKICFHSISLTDSWAGTDRLNFKECKCIILIRFVQAIFKNNWTALYLDFTFWWSSGYALFCTLGKKKKKKKNTNPCSSEYKDLIL